MSPEAYTTPEYYDRLIVTRDVVRMLLLSRRLKHDVVKILKKVAILQPSYIPWKGTFDMINMVDEFVLYDDVQYTKRDWRNRNRVKTAHGVKWLSIPIQVKDIYPFPIYEAKVVNGHWAKEHWRTLETSYAKAPHFERYRDAVAQAYRELGGGCRFG